MLQKALMACILIIGMVACKENNTSNNKQPTGTLVKHTECKSSILDTVPKNFDCLEYSYDSIQKTLYIKHINAAFNCCPGDITAEITFDKDIITINEKEKTPGCRCNCLYDIEYQLSGIEQTLYILSIVEPYTPTTDEKLLVNLNLKEKLSGRICVQRNSYPWM